MFVELLQIRSTIHTKEKTFLRRQASSDSSLLLLDTPNKLSPSVVNKNILKEPKNVETKTELSPIFYISSEEQHHRQPADLINHRANKNSKKIDKMRGTSLRNGGRPANSMEQDSFDSFDDMEDMLVVSTTNSLNLNNPSLR